MPRQEEASEHGPRVWQCESGRLTIPAALTAANFSYGELKVFSGRAHPALAAEICSYLQIPLGQITLYNFSDGED